MHEFSGLLLVDKPTGKTSHDVVWALRKLFKTKQVGHAGTLDPLATGLLVALVGEATRFSDFFLNGDKAYEVEIALGLQTDTWDVDGRVVEQSIETPRQLADRLDFLAEANKLKGQVLLPVPIYSAVKIDGVALHKRARRGELVESPMRQMRFDQIEFLGSSDQGHLRFGIHCGKGAFIRSWVHQLGQNLGVGATVVSLRRTASMPYSVAAACPLASLQPNQEGSWKVELHEAIKTWPTYQVIESWQENLMRNGQLPKQLAERIIKDLNDLGVEGPTGVCVQYASTQKLAALLAWEKDNKLAIRRVYPENIHPN